MTKLYNRFYISADKPFLGGGIKISLELYSNTIRKLESEYKHNEIMGDNGIYLINGGIVTIDKFSKTWVRVIHESKSGLDQLCKDFKFPLINNGSI